MNQLATTQHHHALPALDLAPRTMEEALRFCDLLAKSEIIPRDYQGKPGNIMVAVQWGAEVGLKPMQAMQNIAVINGRPSLWGDALIALVRASSLCEYIVEGEEGDTAWCRVKRRGEPEQMRTFSQADAKAAGLSGKSGPWSQYPKRMRQLRARAFALRDVFPDVLKGMPVAEEVMDYPPETIRRDAPPAQVAAAALPVVEVTDEHKKILADLEVIAAEKGVKAFKSAWMKLTEDQRVALGGVNERDRLLDMATRTDAQNAAAQSQQQDEASNG